MAFTGGMKDVVNYIFLFLIGTTVLNFFIAVAARVKTNNREFNQLVYYWSSLFITYFAVASLSDNPTEIGFAFFFQCLSFFLMTKMLMDSRGIRFNIKYYASMQLGGSVISGYLLLRGDVNFTLAMIPVTVTTSLPAIPCIVNTLVTHRHESNWIERGMGIMFFTGIINNFNYAFFRLNDNNAWWGWSVSIAQYQCLSIFLPLLINHKRMENERKKIELVLEKISGQNSNYNMEIDDLYRNLEIEIALKDELTRKLQLTNGSLEEEREMNEILIKTVSHDLVNPLTVINAYVDMSLSGRIPPQDQEMVLNRIKNNSNSALDMISRIRNAILTRNQASLVAVHDVSIDRSIRRLLESFDTKLKEKKPRVSYTNNLPYDSFVKAEENTLTEHVFANVLSNAIKFSFEGGELRINVYDEGDNIMVEFRDFGAGISKSRLERRLLHSTKGTNGEAGSGFGMMVAGYFLRKFDGSYSINSPGEGCGTSVCINLKKSYLNLRTDHTISRSANIFS
jgi:signal transduction histidine kinase